MKTLGTFEKEVEYKVSEFKQLVADEKIKTNSFLDSILNFYAEKGKLSEKQLSCLYAPVEEYKNENPNSHIFPINYATDKNELTSVKAKVTLFLDEIPSNCTECPLVITAYNEDAFWGSGYSSSCMFGASVYGSAVKRPDDCPIKKVYEKGYKNE